jgi:hypothetical protein
LFCVLSRFRFWPFLVRGGQNHPPKKC